MSHGCLKWLNKQHEQEILHIELDIIFILCYTTEELLFISLEDNYMVGDQTGLAKIINANNVGLMNILHIRTN